MQKISTFFRTLVRSMTSLEYYASVLKVPFSFSLQYFIFFNLLVALITITRIVLPISFFDLPQFTSHLTQIFPADLVVTINKGHLRINKPLPYAIPLPPEWSTPTKSFAPPQNLVVFDSDQNAQGVSHFASYNTFVLITETTVYSQGNSNHEIKASPIPPDLNSTQINRSVINQWREMILDRPFIKDKMYLPLLAIALFILLWPLFIVIHSIAVFVFSIISYIILMIFRKSLAHDYPISWGKVVQVGLHTITPLILVGYVADLVGLGGVWHRLGFSLVYLVLTLWAIYVATAELQSPQGRVKNSQPAQATQPRSKATKASTNSTKTSARKKKSKA